MLKFDSVEAIREWQGPGFVPELPIEIYHDPECPGISNSGIGLIQEGTLADYITHKKQPAEAKDWGNYGNALHTALLQPELFMKKYTHLPEFILSKGEKVLSNFVLKEGKDFRAAAEAEGKECLRYDDYQAIIQSVQNVKKHAYASRFCFEGEGLIEGSCFWKDEKTGVLCKTRPDRITKDIIVEVKTAEDPSPDFFNKSVMKFGYHRQGALQLDGVRAALGMDPQYFAIVAIGKKPPYHVVTHIVQARAIKLGRENYRHVLAKVAHAQETQQWPGYDEILHPLDLPEWAYSVEAK